MQESVNNVVYDAEESDWLDVSYTQRNYLNQAKGRKAKGKFVITKSAKIIAIAIVCVALLGALLFADGDFSKEVFANVKAASGSVFDAFDTPTPVGNTIILPTNVNLVDSVDGVSTFGGGKAVLSFTEGTVMQVEQNSVTVAIDQDTTITYSGMVNVFVNVGDEVSTNTLLGKYDGTFTTVIAEKGEVVKQVVASDSQLTWQV